MDLFNVVLLITPLQGLAICSGMANAISPRMNAKQKALLAWIVCLMAMMISFIVWLLATFQRPPLLVTALSLVIYWSAYGLSHFYFGRKTTARQ